MRPHSSSRRRWPRRSRPASAFLFVEEFTAVLPVGLGFAAGAMVWMVGRELLPEALAQGPRNTVVVDTAVAFALMLVLQLTLSA